MDAFANLDPLGGKGTSSKTPSYPYPVASQNSMPPQNNVSYPPQGGFPPQMNSGFPPQGLMSPTNMGGMSQMNMGMPHMNMGGMPQMNMGMGNMMMPPAAPQMQQPPPGQQPIMYDSILNLLQKKPAPSEPAADAGGADPFSCFTGGPKPSSRTNSGNIAVADTTRTNSGKNSSGLDPFAGGAPSTAASSSANLSIFGDAPSASGNITSSSSTPKNSALADRLRGGKRQTQETQRANLSINSTAVSTGGTSVSIKKQLGGTTSTPSSTAPQQPAGDSLLNF